MRTARAFLALCAAAAWTTAFTTSCGSDEVTGQSALGGRNASAGRGGTTGVGASAGRGGGGGSSGKGGASPTGGATAKSANLGRACTDTSVCGTTSSLECFSDESVPAGLCSRECIDDAECAALSAGALCSGAICFEGCTVGPVALGKCHSRADFACRLVDAVETNRLCTTDEACGEGSLCAEGTCIDVITACLPTCASDSDCGAGFCNYRTGLCDATRPPGKALGAACDLDATVEECAGRCIGDSASGFSMCSGFCTFGLPNAAGCGWNGAGPADSACLFPPAYIAEIEPGDAGYCGQLCDCDGDCRNPNFRCLSFVGEDAQVGEQLQALFQRAGYCTLASPGDVTLPECSSDGAGGAGSTGAAGEPGTSAGAPGMGGSGGAGG